MAHNEWINEGLHLFQSHPLHKSAIALSRDDIQGLLINYKYYYLLTISPSHGVR